MRKKRSNIIKINNNLVDRPNMKWLRNQHLIIRDNNHLRKIEFKLVYINFIITIIINIIINIFERMAEEKKHIP